VHHHAARAHLLPGALGDHGERLDPGGVVGPAGQVDLPGGDRLGDATVDVAGQEPDRALAGGVVAEHDVAVRVHQPGAHGGAVHVHHPLGVAQVGAFADGGDRAPLHQDRVGRGDRRGEVAGEQRADVDERGGGGLGHAALLPDSRRSA